MNYDVIVVRFDYGADRLENGAFVLKKIIKPIDTININPLEIHATCLSVNRKRCDVLNFILFLFVTFLYILPNLSPLLSALAVLLCCAVQQVRFCCPILLHTSISNE